MSKNQKQTPPSKELQEAINRFQEMKNAGKTLYLDGDVFEELAEYYIRNLDFETASEVVDMGLKIHPNEPKLIVLRIAFYLEENKVKEARQLFSTLDDEDLNLFMVEAQILAKEGDDEKVLEILDQINESKLNPIDFLDIGVMCCDMGFEDLAIEWFDKCDLDKIDVNDRGLLVMCGCLQGMEEYERLMTVYNHIIDKNPYCAEAWKGLAKIYLIFEEWEKSLEASDFALVNDENDAEALITKAHCFLELKNTQEALDLYYKVWQMDVHESPYALNFISIAYITLQDWENAIKYLNIARGKDEDAEFSPEMMGDSIQTMLGMCLNDEVLKAVQYIVKRFPKRPEGYLYKGSYYLHNEEKQKATKYFEKALKISSDIEIWYQMGVILEHCDEYDLAAAAFENVYKMDPDYKDVLERFTDTTHKKLEDENGVITRKALKIQLRLEVANGADRPTPIDVNEVIREAREEGKSPEEIEELIAAVKEMNEIIENFDIDEEGDDVS